eukprot:gene751-4043_t
MDYGFGGGFNDYQTHGGGFMGGGGGGTFSQSPADSTVKRISTVTPVCIAQIKAAPRGDDTTFLINNKNVDKVVLIGVIRRKDQKATRISYQIEDHTGMIDVMQYLSGGDDDDPQHVPEEVAQNREGRYVRVVAAIRAPEDDAKRLNAFLVTPIDDLNQVTHHLLSLIHTHLTCTHGIVSEHKLGRVQGQSASAEGLVGKMGFEGGPTGGNTYMDTTTINQAGTGLPRNLQAVLHVIQTEGSAHETGINIDTILDRLRPQGFSESHIRAAIEELLNEGQVYTTINDQFLKSTDED